MTKKIIFDLNEDEADFIFYLVSKWYSLDHNPQEVAEARKLFHKISKMVQSQQNGQFFQCSACHSDESDNSHNITLSEV